MKVAVPPLWIAIDDRKLGKFKKFSKGLVLAKLKELSQLAPKTANELEKIVLQEFDKLSPSQQKALVCLIGNELKKWKAIEKRLKTERYKVKEEDADVWDIEEAKNGLKELY